MVVTPLSLQVCLFLYLYHRMCLFSMLLQAVCEQPRKQLVFYFQVTYKRHCVLDILDPRQIECLTVMTGILSCAYLSFGITSRLPSCTFRFNTHPPLLCSKYVCALLFLSSCNDIPSLFFIVERLLCVSTTALSCSSLLWAFSHSNSPNCVKLILCPLKV